MLVVRADVAFKMPLPLPQPWSKHAGSVLLPHPAPPCARLTQTPNAHRRVGDTFFYVPRDLYGRLRYAFTIKDEFDIKSIALHDLADFKARGPGLQSPPRPERGSLRLTRARERPRG